jgi:hypothetical protein
MPLRSRMGSAMRLFETVLSVPPYSAMPLAMTGVCTLTARKTTLGGATNWESMRSIVVSEASGPADAVRRIVEPVGNVFPKLVVNLRELLNSLPKPARIVCARLGGQNESAGKGGSVRRPGWAGTRG